MLLTFVYDRTNLANCIASVSNEEKWLRRDKSFLSLKLMPIYITLKACLGQKEKASREKHALQQQGRKQSLTLLTQTRHSEESGHDGYTVRRCDLPWGLFGVEHTKAASQC